MSDKAQFSVVILWEHELREAARAIAKLKDIPDEAPEDQKQQAGVHVLGTCWTALRDLVDNPDANLTVMACRGETKRASRGAGDGR